MRSYLIQRGILARDIISDSSGINTAKTSQAAAALLDTRVAVVAISQQYHISRAKLSLKNHGFQKVYGYFPGFFELRDIYSYLREVPAWLFYFLSNK